MHSRVKPRFFAFAVAALVGLGTLIPALPVEATQSAEPPFEVLFPQETSKTYFSSTYGASRSGGRRHTGNDLMAPRMTEIYAVADGVVLEVGTSRLSGRNVQIAHAEGWTSHYVHLNNDTPGTDDGEAPWTLTLAPGVEEGMDVVAGQLIGWVGDSGNAEWTAPHTHFELRRDGVAINPYSILRGAFENAQQREALFEIRLMDDLSDYHIE